MGRVKIFSPAADAAALVDIVQCVIEPLEYSHQQNDWVYFKLPYSLVVEKKGVTVCLITSGHNTSTYYVNMSKTSFAFAALYDYKGTVVVNQTKYNETTWAVYTEMYESNTNESQARAKMEYCQPIQYDKTTGLVRIARYNTPGDNGKESSSGFVFYRK